MQKNSTFSRWYVTDELQDLKRIFKYWIWISIGTTIVSSFTYKVVTLVCLYDYLWAGWNKSSGVLDELIDTATGR